MKKLNGFIVLFLSFVGLLLGATSANGAACTAIANGNWNVQTTWGAAGTGCAGAPGGIPGGGDTVTIPTTRTVTVTVAAAASSLTATGTGTLVNNSTLTLSGALGGTGALTNSATGVLNLGSTSAITTLTATAVGNIVNYTGAAAQTIKATTYATLNTSGAGTKTISAATVVNNTLSVSGGLLANNSTLTVTTALSGAGGLTNGAAGRLNIGGTSTITTLTATAIGNVVTYTGVMQTVKATSYATLNVTGTATNSGTVTVATTLGGTGTLTNTGTLNIGGTSTITTLVTTAVGNIVNYSRAGAQTVKATTYYNLGLSGSGAKTFSAPTLIGGNLTSSGSSTATLTGVTAVTGDVTTSGTSALTTGANLNIGGNLTVGSGTSFTSANFTNLVTGTTSVSGTLAHSGAAAKTYIGAVIINASGRWTNTGNAPIVFRNGLTNNSTVVPSFTSGTGLYTFNTNAQAIGGITAITITNVTVTGITLTNNGTLTATTTLTGTGGLTNSATGTLNIGFAAVPGITTLTATAVGNRVNYTRAGAQTIRAITYHHLGLSVSGAKTAAAGLTVNGDLTFSGTATFTAGNFTHNFAGSWIVNTTAATPLSVTTTSVINFNTPATPAPTSMGGTTTATIAFSDVNINNTSGVTFNDNASFSTGTTPTLTVATGATLTPAAAVIISGTGTLTGSGTAQVTAANFSSQYTITNKTLTNLTVEYTGAAAQTVSVLTYGSATGGGLKINNLSGVSLTANTTVAGTLTLANGVVSAGAFTLISNGDCTTKVARTGGHVAGLLQLRFPTGAPSCTYHVGDATATGYRPINVSFASVTVAGNLAGSVSQAVGEHPNIATSGLEATKDVNRYWTLANPVGGTIAYTTYTATFNFLNPTDLDVGATPANFEIERWSGAAWSVTTPGAVTSASTSASGLPSFGAGSSNSFAVGEKKTSGVVSINRANPSPTTAASVTWTVTFSSSVSGLSSSNFALVNTGLGGTPAITLVSGSGTLWTVTASTGTGSGTLGLNMSNATGVFPAVVGMPFVGEVYTIAAPLVFAEYRMDEASWSAAAGQVIDSSTNGLHAIALGGITTLATPAAAPKGDTCRGTNIPDNNAAGTIEAVNTGIDINSLGNAGTIEFWYKSRLDWNASGSNNDDRTLFDATNNAGSGEFWFVLRKDGSMRFRLDNNVDSRQSVDTGAYAIAAGTWVHLAVTWNFTTGSMCVFVNGVADASCITGDVNITSTNNYDTLYIGDNHGGYTNNVNRGNSADGTIDEVRLYATALTAAQITTDMNTTHTCPVVGPDHLLIEHDGSAISCSAESVVVKACANAACSSLYTGGVTGYLTAGSNSVAFSILNGQSQTPVSIHLPSDSALADPQTVRLGTSTVSPVTTDTGSPYCSINAGVPNNTTACDMSVYKAGFLFDVPNLTSGTASGTVNVSAVNSSDSSTCVPLFNNVTRTVALWGAYQDPASGTLPLQVNGGNIETTAAPAYTSTYSLVFDATGVAPLASVQYDDVGLMRLNARYVGSIANTPPDGGMVVTGSDTFVVKPAGFVISGIKCSTIDAANCGAGALAMPTSGDNPAAADATGVSFIRAGHPFTATVTAMNALGGITKNYGQETAAESVKLTPTNVVAGMVAAPAIGGTFGAFSLGVATGSAFTWGEVGIIKLTPSVGDGDYLGALDVTGTQTGNVGRFYPEHFDTAVVLSSGVPMPCPTGLTCPALYNGFVYSAQPFSLTVTAKNASDVTTANYNTTTGFAKSTTLSALGVLGTMTVPTGTGALGVASVTAFAAGALTEVAEKYTFTNTPTEPTNIYIRASDGEASSLRTINPTTSSVEGGVAVVSGRIKVSNAYGSELLPLALIASAQYYTSGGWVISSTDSVTHLTLLASYPVGAGTTAVTLIPLTSDLSSGKLTIKLGKPSAGAGVATINPIAPAYLPVTQGTATFGVYGGNNTFIYQRESY